MSTVYQEWLASRSRLSDGCGSVPEPSPKLSIVVAAYCEKDNLQKLYEDLVEALTPLDVTWELILVDEVRTRIPGMKSPRSTAGTRGLKA